MIAKLTFWKNILITILMILVIWLGKYDEVSANAQNGIKGNGTNGIYIDINSAPYTTFRDDNGYWGTYAYGPEGCAWFASARANQLTGIGSVIRSGYVWWNNCYNEFGYGRGSEPRPKSLACYTNHVAVVELVEGEVLTVSEGGISKNSSKEYGHCVISTMSRQQVESNRGTGEFLGYVYMSDADTDQVPLGWVDSLWATEENITIAGWAMEPDEPEKTVKVHIYVDGAFAMELDANTLRKDVDQVLGCGAYHGFEKTFSHKSSKTGKHRVEVFAINTNGSGNNPYLQNGNQEISCESIEQKMKNALTPQQFLVYQLTNIMSEPQYSMRASVDDDYYDRKTKAAWWGNLSFNKVGKWFLGTAEEDYYRKAMAECITLGTLQEENGTWEVEKFLVDEGVETIESLNEIDEFLTESQKAAIDVYNFGSDYIDNSSDAGALLQKISYFSGSLLNALEVVEKQAERDSDIQNAAEYVISAAHSTEMFDKFRVWSDQFLRDAVSVTMDTMFSIVTCGITEWTSMGHEILAGDAYDKEMEELFYLNLQMEIAAAFSDITEKYPNILEAEYSNEDLKDLYDLALLYLKCGKLGFAYNFSENENACISAYQEVQSWDIPWNGKVVKKPIISIYDHNLPGTLSQGDTYVVYGTVTAENVLKNVSIEISGVNGYLKEIAENINANQYDLYLMDKKISINHLKAGEYEYIVTAETVNGYREEVVRSSFTIRPEDGNIIITGYRLPKPMKQGDIFYVTGTIKSQSEMRNVKVEICDENGVVMTGGEENGSFYTYNLKNLDPYVKFDILQAGTYRYIIKATNSSGEEVLVNQEFIVR